MGDFLELARGRRAVRRFGPDPVPEEKLERALEAARWAPSGYNLQPTRWVVVRQADLKAKLHRACLNQKQILGASAVVVFVGDPAAWQRYRNEVLEEDIRAGAINREYAAYLEKWVKIGFDPGPMGLLGPIKRWGAAMVGWFRPVAKLPLADPREWTAKQVMLSAMNFMLACEADGIATVPMEGFDEGRVRRALGIPSDHGVYLVVATGFGAEQPPSKSRRPLAGTVHRDGWRDSGTHAK